MLYNLQDNKYNKNKITKPILLFFLKNNQKTQQHPHHKPQQKKYPKIPMRKKYDKPAPLTINFTFDPQLLDLIATTYQNQNQSKYTQKVVGNSSDNKPKRSLSQKRFNQGNFNNTAFGGSMRNTRSMFGKSLRGSNKFGVTYVNNNGNNQINMGNSGKNSSIVNLNKKLYSTFSNSKLPNYSDNHNPNLIEIDSNNAQNQSKLQPKNKIPNHLSTSSTPNKKQFSQKISSIKKNSPIINSIDQQRTKSMLKNIRKNILSLSINPPELLKLEKTYKQLLEKFKKY